MSSSKLVIVESPKKAKTISGKLDKGFTVISTKGHIKDLPKKRIGINVNNNFECDWEIVPGKEKLIREILNLSGVSGQVLLASDPDREGEAIAYHVYEIIRKEYPEIDIKRIVFNEITQNAINNAVNNPRDIDYNLFESQKARRILDRLVGFLLSPLLIYFLKRNLSAGRVQSVALKLIVDQEKQILRFIPEEYWRFFGLFNYDKREIELELKRINNKKISIDSAEKAEITASGLRKAKYLVKDIIRDIQQKIPSDPFKTSTLQQEANIRFNFSGKKTMMIAQALYEGKTIDKEDIGLITYMRTDSVRISDEARHEAIKYIEDGLQLKARSGKKPDNSKSRTQKIQDAHEAIRPSNPNLSPDRVEKYLTKDENKIYDLIWRRYIASFLCNAVYDKLTVAVEGDGIYLFEAVFMQLSEEGFLKVYKPLVLPKTVKSFPELQKGRSIILSSLRTEQHFTEPPKRFTEAGLIKTLEKEGIGRPSTYATILDTLKKRDYIKLEKKTIFPSSIGVFVAEILEKFFNTIINIHFTADMENNLDNIEQGKEDWVEMIRSFYQTLYKTVNNAKNELRKGIKTQIKCPDCGSDMLIKFSGRGEYLSCTNYPLCRTKKSMDFDEKFNPVIQKHEESSHKCPDCGKPLLIKKGKYGKFYGCSSYPECRFTQPVEKTLWPGFRIDMIPEEFRKCSVCGARLNLERGRFSNYMVCTNPECRAKSSVNTGIKCPADGCKGYLTEKHKKGRVFYSCSLYPECKTTVPYKPIVKKCPKCGYSVMYETESAKKTLIKCASKACRYSEAKEVQKP